MFLPTSNCSCYLSCTQHSGSVLIPGINTHKELQKLEDSFVCQDVEGIATDRVDDRKSMDLVLDE